MQSNSKDKKIKGMDDYYNDKDKANIDNNCFYKQDNDDSNSDDEDKNNNNNDNKCSYNDKNDIESNLIKNNQSEYDKRVEENENEEFNYHKIKYININGENIDINKLAINNTIIDQILEDKEKHLDLLSAKFDYEKAKFHFLANQIYRKDLFENNESNYNKILI